MLVIVDRLLRVKNSMRELVRCVSTDKPLIAIASVTCMAGCLRRRRGNAAMRAMPDSCRGALMRTQPPPPPLLQMRCWGPQRWGQRSRPGVTAKQPRQLLRDRYRTSAWARSNKQCFA